MSKKKKYGSGRSKRKTPRLENRVIRRVKHNLERGITPSEYWSVEESYDQCQGYLRDVLYYHYILIVIDDLIEAKAIIGHVVRYPIKEFSLELKAISENLSVVKTLEDDFAYMEVLELAERLKPIAQNAVMEFERAERIYPRFLAIIKRLTEQLPVNEKQEPLQEEEKIELVIKSYAIGKMVNIILTNDEVPNE